MRCALESDDQRLPTTGRDNDARCDTIVVRWRRCFAVVFSGLVVAALVGCPISLPISTPPRFPTATRSTSITLTSNDRRLVSVNRHNNSVSIISVRDASGGDTARKLAELPVGQDPRCLAMSPDDNTVYVTNGASGTVSVIDFTVADVFEVVAEIPVGTEPRGCALTPNGSRLYVANHTSGTVSVIDTATRRVIQTIDVGGRPAAVAITNDADVDEDDETVFVTQFFAERIPAGPGEGFDTGKRGIVMAFSSALGDVDVTRISLSPIADVGFTADRTRFCRTFDANIHSDAFCPDTNASDATSETIVSDPQGAFPNQLYSCLVRGNRLFVPSVGAGPEPPVQFDINTQALVHNVDTASLSEVADEHVNLNEQIKEEPEPDGSVTTLERLFASDIVAMDADFAGSDFLFVSRGGNYVLRARRDADGVFTIDAPGNVQRFQTGNIPSGIVISSDGSRAYTNNEVSASVTVIDLNGGGVIQRDISSSRVPEPGTVEHAARVGKLVFHTALGIPDDNLFGTDLRDIVPLTSRGKASRDGWSSCASCHPDGLSDGVTWFMSAGPRQTVPLDAFFAPNNPSDQRIAGWSGNRGSVTDFNGYARDVQGGTGFAGDPPDSAIYDHGVTQSTSDALDAMTLWVQTVRPLMMPVPTDSDALERGRVLFEANCASCHGGAKWTKSQVLYADNPAFRSDPLAGGVPRDAGVTNVGSQMVAYTSNGNHIAFIEDVGTYDGADALEIRGSGDLIGQISLGDIGFNVPSLLGVGYHGSYLHNGRAATLAEVFVLHELGEEVIATAFSDAERLDLEVLLNSIDGRTEPMRSDADAFRDAVAE